MRKVVPLPAVVVTSMVPAQLTDDAVDNTHPRPVPLSTGLVGEEWVEYQVDCLFVYPHTVVADFQDEHGWLTNRRLAVSSNLDRPTSAMASRAFRHRFMTTCSICPGSANTGGTVESSSIAIEMDEGNRFRTRPSVSRITWFKQISVGF